MAELETTPCCTPEVQARCCEAEDKADCCGHAAGCGCSAGTEEAELEQVRETVRARYAASAQAAGEGSGCGCGATVALSDEQGSQVFGSVLYASAEADAAPSTAIDASLGCGVPTAVADLHAGEIVLDLGTGAGADVLISARRVGPTGRAIGLDMTDEMLELARANAAEAGVENVEFLKGYLEDMPLENSTVDVVISNCVINLSGDKPQVLREAGRVLRPGGRFAVSDVIGDPDMDEQTRADMAAWTGCVAGALTEAEFRDALPSRGIRPRPDPRDSPRPRARQRRDHPRAQANELVSSARGRARPAPPWRGRWQQRVVARSSTRPGHPISAARASRCS
jgi:arsenite methyltransferase